MAHLNESMLLYKVMRHYIALDTIFGVRKGGLGLSGAYLYKGDLEALTLESIAQSALGDTWNQFCPTNDRASPIVGYKWILVQFDK